MKTTYSQLDLDNINDEWFHESKEALEAERVKQGRRVLQRQKTISWKDKVEETNEENKAVDEIDWSTYSKPSNEYDSDDDSDVGMSYSQNQRKLKKLVDLVDDAFFLPYKNKHGMKKLPYDFFYEKNDDEDHDEFIYDERDDGNEESLRMGIKAKRVFKKFMRDAIEENIECTYTSFVESFNYKGMSRHTLAHLFVILGDDVDCSDPIESPGVSSVPSSGIVAKKVFKTPKRAIPINYERMTNDEQSG
jgi:hypothetical protein